MPAQILRWGAFTAVAIVVSPILAYQSEYLVFSSESFNLIGRNFVQFFLIRGALFDPFWNGMNGHSIFYQKTDDVLRVRLWEGFVLKIPSIDHPAYWIGSEVAYILTLIVWQA